MDPKEGSLEVLIWLELFERITLAAVLKTDWSGVGEDSNTGSSEASQVATEVRQGKGDGELARGQPLFCCNDVTAIPARCYMACSTGTRLLAHFYADTALFLSPAIA